MAGPWNPANPPVRSGAYTNWEVQSRSVIDAPLQGVVAIPFTHDYGPFKQVVELSSFGEFLDVFGGSNTTPGYRAVYQAFKGEAVNSRGGAARVVAYRMGGSSAAKASKALTSTDSGSPTAITVVAKYEGDWAERLKVEVSANAADPTNKHDFVIYNGSTELERYTYAKADINALKAALLASEWVDVPSAVVSGFALTTTAAGGVALTGGDDGSTLTGGDWTTAMSALSARRFNVVAPFDVRDDSIVASLKAWAADPVTGLNVGGKRVLLVVGGTTSAASDAMSASVTRAATLNNENIVCFGGVTAQDAGIVDANGDPVTLTSSQLVPRIAGIIAANGEGSSSTFSRLGDLTLVTAPNEAEIKQSLGAGVMTLAEDSNRLSPVRIERGITSYISDSSDKPKDIYGVLKFVLTMHGIEMEITEFAENNVIGRLAVNDATREYLVGQMKSLLRSRVEGNIIAANPVVRISNDPPPTPQDDFISLEYEILFGRALEQVRNTVVVG